MKTSFIFKCLETHEIEECAHLVSRSFFLYDPFIKQLELSQQELFEKSKEQMKLTINDQLIVISKDPTTNKIIGCFAGFKWSNYKFQEQYLSKNSKKFDFIVNNKISDEEKYEFLDRLEAEVLCEQYKEKYDKKELDKCIFCDFYCIADNYFQTDLNVKLIYHFYLNAQKKGIENAYALFFNPKAISLVVKYLPFKIIKEFKVKIEQKEHMKEFQILLLHGQIQKVDLEKLIRKKPKL